MLFSFQQISKLFIYHQKAFNNSNFMCKRSSRFMISSPIIYSYLSFFCLQVVANCLCSLQEIWGLEATKSEEASTERETLLSKPLIYYLLNRWIAVITMWLNTLSEPCDKISTIFCTFGNHVCVWNNKLCVFIKKEKNSLWCTFLQLCLN